MILKRKGAEATIRRRTAQGAELDKVITEAEKDELIDSIIVKTQGFVNGNIKEGDKNPVAIFATCWHCMTESTVLRCVKTCVISWLPLCRYAKNTREYVCASR